MEMEKNLKGKHIFIENNYTHLHKIQWEIRTKTRDRKREKYIENF